MNRDFILGVIGDFSGAAEARSDRFVDVDRDTFATLFERLAPRIELGLPFCETLELSDWEDWHPDALVRRVPTLAKLREARAAAGNAEKMRALLADAGVAAVEETAEAAPPAGPPPAEVSEAELLDDLLAGAPKEGAPLRLVRHVADPAFERLVAEIAEPHAERIDHAGIAARREAVDRELGARLRSLLRHPALQRREALWRSLRALVFGSETSERLRIRIFDADPDRLRGEPGGALAETLRQRIVTDEKGTLGGTPFGLLVVEAWVAGAEDDLLLLERLGALAAEAEAPCLLEAGPGLWAAERRAEAEAFLRQARALRGAERLAVCAPGLLARLPYGRAGDPVEGFAFEEVDPDTDVSAYCWGGAAFAVAAAAAEAAAETGRASQAARFARREGLPFHPAGPGGEPAGPARQLLPDAEIERLRALGILPVAGVRGRDTAVITSLTSLTGRPLFAERL